MSKEEIEKNEETKTPKESKSNFKTFFSNHWAVATVVLAVLLLLILFTNMTGNTITGNVISEASASDTALTFLNAQTGGGVELIDIQDAGALYEVTVSYQGQEIPVHITKDGKYFGSMNLIPTKEELAANPQTPQPTEVPKSDKPVVELFIMTHCPYGTQAEKGIIPAIEALGNTVDAKIRFVHYFMHDPEEAETPLQICIREEQTDKYYDYLKAFLADGDTDKAQTTAKIDKTKLTSCIADKSEQYYETDSALSQGYGVQGSPTLVINGVQATSGRDSASYLNTICSAFNTAPEECDAVISSASPSPGFGYEAGTDTGAQC